MFDLGSSSNQNSNSQQLASNNNFNFNMGGSNENGADIGGQTLKQEQSRKDEFGLSASVGVGVGGDGSGGVASLARSGDMQNGNSGDNFAKAPKGSFLDKINHTFVYIGLASILGLYIIFQLAGFKFSKAK